MLLVVFTIIELPLYASQRRLTAPRATLAQQATRGSEWRSIQPMTAIVVFPTHRAAAATQLGRPAPALGM